MISRRFSCVIILFSLLPFLYNASPASSQYPYPFYSEEGASQITPISPPSVKSIKTPKGTVKCSCQPVEDETNAAFIENSGGNVGQEEKTIEIEIHSPSETDDMVKPTVRNSFTLDDKIGDEDDDEEESQRYQSKDRVFSTEEPPSFLSYLSAIASQENTKILHEKRRLEVHEKDEEEASSSSNSYSVETRHPQHRFETEGEVVSVPVPSSFHNSGYKAFRSAELNESPATRGEFARPHLTNIKPTTSTFIEDRDPLRVSQGNREVDEAHESNSYFLWDFIYGGGGGSGNHRVPMSHTLGKKKELLYLGSMIDSFKGPRRRRRSLRGNNNRQASTVFYVYPEGYKPPEANGNEQSNTFHRVAYTTPTPEKNKTINNNVRSFKIQERSEEWNREEIKNAMQAALDKAWEEYGPNGVHAVEPVVPPPPAVVQVTLAEQPPLPEVALATPREVHPPPHPPSRPIHHQQQPPPPPVAQSMFYTPPRPFLYIDRIFNPFQPMSSEWDKNVASYPLQGPPPPPPEPGYFSRFLARYIDFEVNNHETADLMRRVVLGIFVGFLVLCWIGLGVLLGVVPLKKWMTYMSGVATGTKRNYKGKEFSTRDTAIADITDKILLSLDADWLKRLEERVKGTTTFAGKGGNSRGFPTQVFCCILPDEQTNGMVECEVTRTKKRKPAGAFKCISDLIYNFQFGPKEDTSADEQDNTVNSKSKANSNFQNKVANVSENGNQTVTVSFE